jgi:CDP-glucose 4,6-dehydratase
VGTITTNAIGTMTLLEALRGHTHPCVAVLITSDKCYDNVEWVWGYRETDALGGKDVYSGSKGAAELVIRSYVASFFPADGKVRIGVGRAGNVIGGGDWARDRIVADCMRAWSAAAPVEIRSPKATRPWQHVLEPLSGYLALGAALHESAKLHGEAFNFGPRAEHNHTVLELIQSLAQGWGHPSGFGGRSP